MTTRHEFLVVVDGIDLSATQCDAIETAVKLAAADALGALNIPSSSSPLQDEVAAQAFDPLSEEGRPRHPMGIIFRPGRGQ